jgi:hypothetical protein
MSTSQDTPHRTCHTCGYNLAGVPEDNPCPECGKANDCVGCGYNLAGLKPGARCPECGKASPIPNAHTADVLDAFCFCTECGYHLYLIPKKDKCPECGQPAEESTIDQSLYRSGASYLHSLRKGYQTVQVGLFTMLMALVVVFIGPPLISLLARTTGVNTAPIGRTAFGGLFFLACILGGGIVLLLGAIAVTTRDPHLGVYASSERTRSITRTLAIINFLLYMPGIFCLPFVGGAAGAVGAFSMLILYAGSAVGDVIASVAYSERITQRLGTKKLVRSHNRYSIVLMAIMALAFFFSLPLLFSVIEPAAPTVIAIAGIGFTVCFIAGYVIYLLTVSNITKQLKLAFKRGEAIPHSILKPGETNTI